MVQYASGSIKFSGLGSDTDFQSMIDKLYSIETRHVNQLLRWKADWQQRLEAFQQVRSELMTLQSSLLKMNSMDKFLAKVATSSDEKVATATAGADVMNGTYSLDIKQLAANYSWSKNTGLYEKNDVIADVDGGGSLTYRYKGVERTLTVPKGTTIDGLKNLINNDAQNPGVKAQLIHGQDGIVFQLSSKDTGSANTLVITNITGMTGLGNMVLDNVRYEESESSMVLAEGFTSPTDIINSTSEQRTFIFTIDGKKKSIGIDPGETVQDLVTKINTWANDNVKKAAHENIAFLEERSDGKFYFTLAKQDSVYGAGTYNKELQDVLTDSHANANAALFTTGPDRQYEVTITPPDGVAYTLTTTLSAGETLTDLKNKFQTEITTQSANTTVDIVTDPKDAGKVKLIFGPVASSAMQTNILDKAWDSDSDLLDTTVDMEYAIRVTNSDLGTQDSDIIRIQIPKDSQHTIRSFCNTLNDALGSRGTAKLVQDGSGKWRVVMETNSATHRVTVEEGTLEDFKYQLPTEQSGSWVIAKGENAKLRVNGWPKEPDLLEYASNNIPAGAVIDGMSLVLRSTGTAVISVANDTEKITENVEEFVAAVNNFRLVLQSLTAVDEEKTTLDPDYAESQFEMQKGGVLTGNYGIQMLSSRLKSAVSSTGQGFVHRYKDPVSDYLYGDTFSALSQIGITTNAEQGHTNYGLLEINYVAGYKGSKSLTEALAEDPEAVARLFSAQSEGRSNNQDLFQHNSHIPGFAKAGTYDVEYTIALDSNNDPYIDTAFINGKAAKIDQENMRITLMEPSDDPARSIAVDIYNLTPGVQHKGTVSIRDGKTNELLNMMDGTEGLLGSKGTLKNLETNYTNIIDNIEKKIKQEDDRLVKWRRTMDLKFSRLEATLARYNAINESLKTQIGQLGQSTKSS